MSENTTRTRPGTMRLIDATRYRLPLAGLVSILHRASGALLLVLLPFVLWARQVRAAAATAFVRLRETFR